MIRLLGVMIFLGTGSVAWAQKSCWCPENAVYRPIEDLSVFIHKTMVIDDPDRNLLSDFAKLTGESLKAVQQRFAPTGFINCTNGTKGSAQLTGDADVITTVNHAFFDDCGKKVSEPNQCTFTIESPAGTQIIPLDYVVKDGFRCPQRPTQDRDWAVIKLKWPAKCVRPYRVRQDAFAGLTEGTRVVNVCRSKDFRPDLGSPKHAGFCNVRKVYRPPYPPYLGTDCDAGTRCSGGSLLAGNEDDPVLLGVVRDVGIGETYEDEQRAIDDHRMNARPYNERTWATHYVPVTGEFLQAIKLATKSNPEREKARPSESLGQNCPK